MCYLSDLKHYSLSFCNGHFNNLLHVYFCYSFYHTSYDTKLCLE